MRNSVCLGLVLTIVSGLYCATRACSDATPAPTTTVYRAEDGALLEGVTGFSFAEKVSSVHAAQEAAMRALGENVDYNYLVGVSGLAFRMQVFKDGLCPSSPHPCCGYECVSRSNEALPWNIRSVDCKAQGDAARAETRKMVVASIDRGIPVAYGSEENGLIIGYRKAGAEWMCLHPMKADGKRCFVETAWPWGLTFFSERKQEPVPKVKLERDSLAQALKMADTEECNGHYVGFKAWDKLIEDIKALDKADEKTLTDSMLGNAWIYDCLAADRRSAAIYLRTIAGDFPSDASAHLLRAADVYSKVADMVLTDKDHCCSAIAPYRDSLKPGDRWTPEMRAEEVRRLQKAIPLERLALREIAKAIGSVRE